MNQGCVQCPKLQKELRVRRADFDFELKKMQEDLSTDKAIFEANLQKEVRRLHERLARETEMRNNEGAVWLIKYDQAVKDHHIALLSLQKSHNEQLAQTKSELELHYGQIIRTIKDTHKTEAQKLKLQSQATASRLIEQQSRLVKEMDRRHTEDVFNVKKFINGQLEDQKLRYEETIRILNHEKTFEEEKHNKTKSQFNNMKTQLHSQLAKLKVEYCLQTDCLHAQRRQCSALKDRIKELQVQLDAEKQRCEQEIAKILRDNSSQLSEVEKKNQLLLQKSFAQQAKKCDHFGDLLKKLDDLRLMEVAKITEGLQQVRQCAQSRPSRHEDTLLIDELQEKLHRKEKELEVILEELRWYRLELENKEQTYNRIFVPTPSADLPIFKRYKEGKVKRTAKSITTVREILNAMGANSNYTLGPLQQKKQSQVGTLPKSSKVL